MTHAGATRLFGVSAGGLPALAFARQYPDSLGTLTSFAEFFAD